QALPPLNPSPRVDGSLHRNDQSIVEALMISFIMIMLHEIADTAPQRVFTKEDHLLQTLFLDRSYESFRVGIQIWASGRQPYGFDWPRFQQSPNDFPRPFSSNAMRSKLNLPPTRR